MTGEPASPQDGPLAVDPDVADRAVEVAPGKPSVDRTDAPSLLQRARSLWCAFLSGLG